jgi:hypothetical protein
MRLDMKENAPEIYLPRFLMQEKGNQEQNHKYWWRVREG